MSTTTIDLREPPASPWVRVPEKRHRFRLRQRRGWVLEAEDLNFHTGSAVLLPDYDADDRERICGLAVIRAALEHTKAHPERRILVVGHTDTTGTDDTNLKLSWRRAENVALLLQGDRDGWVASCREYHVVADYQRIFRWLAEERGWLCHPGEVDGELGPNTHRATESFQAQYNVEFNADIDTDGDVGRQTWEAIFDILWRDLAELMQTDASGLTLRAVETRWVDDERKFVGCGEFFPIENERQDDYRSETNRRVEILFFDKDQPKLDAWPKAHQCTKDLCRIYDPRVWSFEHIPCDPIPRLVWIDLQLSDLLGMRVADHPLVLELENGERLNIFTGADGYWSGRLIANEKVKVLDNDDIEIRHATEEKGPPLITPKVATRTITDLIIALGDKEVVARQRGLLRRYRAPDSVKTVRGGDADEAEGEKVGEASGRGGRKTLRHRNRNALVADNVWLAAGFNDAGDIDTDELLPTLRGWLRAHHPTALSDRGYFVHLLLGREIITVRDDHTILGRFTLRDDIWLAGFGAHAVLESQVAKGNRKFLDLASSSLGIKVLDKPPSNEGGDDPVLPGPVEQVDHELELIIEGDQIERFRKVVLEQIAGRRVELVYNVPPGPAAVVLALHGGTGVLEPYPGSDLDDSIHERNLAICKWVNIAYKAYLTNYLERLDAIPNDPRAVPKDSPHPEALLHRMGPPREHFMFPRPAGASDAQYLELLDSMTYTSFEAWSAIAEKLDLIWGKRSEGSLWVVFEFSAELGKTAGGALGSSSVKLNFLADSQGRIEQTTPHEIKISATTDPSGKKLGNGEISTTIDPKTGQMKTTAGINVGPYGIQGDTQGTVKMMNGPHFVETNAVTGIVGTGFELSARDLALKAFKAKNGDEAEPPAWVAGTPDIKAKVSVNVRLSSEGTIRAALSMDPGFFEKRPRSEFAALAWDSLYSDEQAALRAFGFDRESFDTGQLPDACKKPWVSLTPEQKSASGQIPAPHSDPEWQGFWGSVASLHAVSDDTTPA